MHRPKECETKEKPDASTHQSRFVFLVSKVRFSCLFCINKNKINYYVMNNINYNNTSSNRRRFSRPFRCFYIFVVSLVLDTFYFICFCMSRWKMALTKFLLENYGFSVIGRVIACHFIINGPTKHNFDWKIMN